MQIVYGLILAALIAYLAYRAQSLNRNGAFAAILVGTIVFGLGGLQWAILLMVFFITSSGMSRAFKKRKQGLNEKFSKGSERDAGQVFGNGGLATLFVLVHAIYPESIVGWVGFLGDGVGRTQSDVAAHDHQFRKARRKRDLGRDFVIWNIGIPAGSIDHCLASSLVCTQLGSFPNYLPCWSDWLAL